MKAALLALAAAALLAGCATYGDRHGYGYPAGNVQYSTGAATVYGAPGYHGGPGYYGAAPYGAAPYGAPGYYGGVPQGTPRRAHRDRDRDGIPNRMDEDRDGDGVPNQYDARPNDPRYR